MVFLLEKIYRYYSRPEQKLAKILENWSDYCVVIKKKKRYDI